ncbi:Uncharacterised protein [Haemophilus parahaemolyticus]|uniref:Uncharacterized protein n=1 Tax=Haemophilus parahaemolyticus TaxID=735 RepID=A0A377I0U4_HAEPH|nr:Uncharacterised protein [Haemophilus parahaemolyticus]
MVTEDFKKVAVSFAGGDGGNPNSDVWFCGLEWGLVMKLLLMIFIRNLV